MHLLSFCRGPPPGGCGFFVHTILSVMISSAEYLTNLRQAALLNNMLIPPITFPVATGSMGSSIPLAATVPFATQPEHQQACADLAGNLLGSLTAAFATIPQLAQVAIGTAALIIAIKVTAHYVAKYGPGVLSWFKRHAHQFLSAIGRLLQQKRMQHLLPAAQTIVVAA